MPDMRQAAITPRSPVGDSAAAGTLPAVRATSFDDDIDVARFLEAIKRRWLLLSAVALAFGAVSFALAIRAPILYEASATLVLAPGREGATLPRNVHTARALLTSPALVSDALRGTPLEGSATAPEFSRRSISVDDMPAGQFLRVRVRAPSPELAAGVTKALVDRAAAQADRLERSSASRINEELKRQLARAAERFTEAERRLLEYGRRAPQPGSTSAVGIVLPRYDPLTVPISPRGEATAGIELKQPDRLLVRDLELARIGTDYDIARRVYFDFGVLHERTLAEVSSAVSLIRIVDPDIAPGVPLARGVARKTALGVLVGLLAGLAVVIAWEARGSGRTR
jgi:uncharacterized protein involved in exopolysaccharide biosynthesis